MEFKAPYLGVAYYPEDWPDAEMDKDIQRMKEIGINAARIAEFAWHRMEPKDGEFDFSFFRKVVDKLGNAGIAVIMGTPTATPPRWLSRKYPDMLAENMEGRLHQHGGRRHCCSNNVHYNEYSMRIVEKMAKEFADHPAIIGWQIDNEIYSHGTGCFCRDCLSGFQEKLHRKFGTIDALNEAWNLNLFSQWYDDFSDIPAPRDAWHNPHLIMEWRIFQNESHVAFVHRQAEILHRYVKVPVGTDIMPINGMDYHELQSKLDVMQFNHYNEPSNLYACSFWFDYLRTMKDRPFWNTETLTCWTGSTDIIQGIKPEGFCRVNSWLPVALGAEANMYWLWRTHWAGHELLHGSVIDTSGRDMHIVGEVTETANGFKKSATLINGTRVQPDLAIHFSPLNWNMRLAQPVVRNMTYEPEIERCIYQPAVELGLRPDVIDASADLNKYKLVFSPLMMTLEEHDLPRRITEWVKEGGTWVVGPMSDIRNADGARFKDRFYGILEELTGVKGCYNVPDTNGLVKAEWSDGTAFTGESWFEMRDDCGTDTLVRVTAGHSAVIGKSLVVMKNVGKGCVIMLGSLPSNADAKRLIRLACSVSNVKLPEIEGGIMVSKRKGDAGEALMLVEYENSEAAYVLDQPMTDVITGEKLEGRIELKPYDVKILKYS